MRGRYAIFGKELLHSERVAVRFRFSHHQFRPGNKRPEKLPHRDIKTARRFLGNDIFACKRVVVLHPKQAVNDSRLPDHYPFRPAGGAGGKDDISRVVRL